MAKISNRNNNLILELSWREKIGALHDSIYFRKDQVIAIDKIEKIWSKEHLRGIRSPGTGIPYVIMLGTLRYKGGKDFCAIYKSSPAYVIELNNHKFNRLIVSETHKNISSFSELTNTFQD